MNREGSYTQEGAGRPDGTANASLTPSYRAVLQEPMASLVDTSNDRPDVASVAILGYN